MGPSVSTQINSIRNDISTDISQILQNSCTQVINDTTSGNNYHLSDTTIGGDLTIGNIIDVQSMGCSIVNTIEASSTAKLEADVEQSLEKGIDFSILSVNTNMVDIEQNIKTAMLQRVTSSCTSGVNTKFINNNVDIERVDVGGNFHIGSTINSGPITCALNTSASATASSTAGATAKQTMTIGISVTAIITMCICAAVVLIVMFLVIKSVGNNVSENASKSVDSISKMDPESLKAIAQIGGMAFGIPPVG